MLTHGCLAWLFPNPASASFGIFPLVCRDHPWFEPWLGVDSWTRSHKANTQSVWWRIQLTWWRTMSRTLSGFLGNTFLIIVWGSRSCAPPFLSSGSGRLGIVSILISTSVWAPGLPSCEYQSIFWQHGQEWSKFLEWCVSVVCLSLFMSFLFGQGKPEPIRRSTD